MVDLKKAEVFINSNFSSSKQERLNLLKLYQEIPYQYVNDSPTVKHYTEWNEYENANLNIAILGGTKTETPFEGFNNILIVNNNIIGDVEIIDSPENPLISLKEHKLVPLILSLSKRLKISRPGKYFIYHYVTEENVFSPLNLEIDAQNDIEVIYYAETRSKNSFPAALISLNINDSTNVKFTHISYTPSSYFFSLIKANIKGSLTSYYFTTASRMAHVEALYNLKTDSVSNFSARALGVNDDKIDIKLNVYHEGQKSVSNGTLKAVSAENSLTVIRGDAVIGEEAIGSSTSILGKALMLSQNSKSVASPSLEVRTGDIELAKHSASVSKVPEDYIFYLKTRGFTQKESESLIIRGFLIEDEDPEFLKELVDKNLKGVGY
ncbi:MAG: SufD family Fe-S cluster assembly protein [Sulfolobaceae archaeon]|nr:SufD family Fe-S cluster assembly protein [Sulfolobaceae archaeon]